MRAQDPVEKIHACSTNSSAKSKRFILQFPTVTLVDVSVTVYPNHADHGSSNFLREDYISYCTTLRGPDNLFNVIFLGYTTVHCTKSTHFSQIYTVFIIGKMCFATGWNCFVCRIYPTGRSMENPGIDYEEEWWQHTPLSESNTNTERLWFNSVDRETIFWKGIQLLDDQQQAPVNNVLPQHPQKLFTRNPAMYFPEVDKTFVDVFGMLLGFLENLLESGNLFCSATPTTKTALGIILLWFNSFSGIMA